MVLWFWKYIFSPYDNQNIQRTPLGEDIKDHASFNVAGTCNTTYGK
jgi:hypothetical protein